jgi:hypothetical protein
VRRARRSEVGLECVTRDGETEKEEVGGGRERKKRRRRRRGRVVVDGIIALGPVSSSG